MSTEVGHAPNRVYLDQEGNIHLNGGSFYDNNGNSMTPGSGISGLTLALLQLTGPLRMNSGAAVAATGTAQGNAAQLVSGFNPVTGANNSNGAILPTPGISEIVLVKNTNANNTFDVYPNVGSSINGGSANAAVSVAASKMALFAADNTGTGGRCRGNRCRSRATNSSSRAGRPTRRLRRPTAAAPAAFRCAAIA